MVEPLLLSGAPRRSGWEALTDSLFDLLVVGGGIHGAGVARDAALRGLRVAVVDRGDWAAGTSSRSSKLLHGGLRYLRQGAFPLVRESLRERDLHLRLAPDSVRRLRFEVPSLRPAGPPRWQVRAGIALYDALTLGASRASVLGGVPAYDDAAVDDAGFCLSLILDARTRGAVARNYTEWLAWEREGDRIIGARLRDRVGGMEGVARARACVNAAGPWACDLVPGEDPRPRLRLTRGTHVILRAPVEKAQLFFAEEDGRVLFLLPFGPGHALVGTTDLDEAEPSPEPVPREEEVRYLARACLSRFPAVRGWEAVGLQCGLRPLVHASGPAGAVSREERVEESTRTGLLSILGGKYTTYRAVAERVVDRVEEALRGRVTGRPTRTVPIPGRGSCTVSAGSLRATFVAEDAVRLEDVLLRRSRLGHVGPPSEEVLAKVLEAWKAHWGAGAGAAEREREEFLALQRARRAPLAAWERAAASD